MRQRLDGVADVAISQSRQTVDVRFAAGDHALPIDVFREAVGEADVEILQVEIDACGDLEGGHGGVLSTGKNRFALEPGHSLAAGQHACVSGRLWEGTPPRLAITRVHPPGD